MKRKCLYLAFSFLLFGVLCYHIGYTRGSHDHEGDVENRTGIKLEQWKSIQDSYKKRFDTQLEKIKNGL